VWNISYAFVKVDEQEYSHEYTQAIPRSKIQLELETF